MFDARVYLQEKSEHVMFLRCVGMKLVFVTPSRIEFCIFHEFHLSSIPKINDVGHDTDFFPNHPALNRANPGVRKQAVI